MSSFKPEHPILDNPTDWSISQFCAVKESWSSLLPLFAKGYIEYPEMQLTTLASESVEKEFLEIAQSSARKHCKRRFSFSIFRYKSTSDFQFPLPSTLKAFWDKNKRDVIFKRIYGNELKVLQYLNAPEMRANPMNRTIPVLEFITHDTLTFAAMPRYWEGALGGLWADFADVRQLMHACQHLCEGLVFLHEHRIVHGDIDGRNTAFNAIADPLDEHPTGLLDPISKTEFVFLDFGMSSIYSIDADLDNVAPVQVIYNFPNLPPPAPPLPEHCNLFRADVLNLANCLQHIVRVAQNIIPELIPFFEEYTSQNMGAKLSARKMLDAFQTMYANIPQEKLTALFIFIWNLSKFFFGKAW
ncbi:hypothetical protein C8J56DRAFT_1096620 [Mycena floridula]|nr:hypothetical protein C8J56DRAFT_1096620 [Mycena floridula]